MTGRVHAVRADVRRDEEVASRLRGAVGARGPQLVALAARPLVEADVAVDLVRRDVHEPLARLARPLQEHVRAEDVRAQDGVRLQDRPVDVRLRREVHHRISALGGPRDGSAIGDVAVDELVLNVLEVRAVAAVRQLVEDDDAVPGSRESAREMRADEAGAAGDENAHRGKPSRGRTGEP